MGTGWAVASATLLALSLAHVFLDMEVEGVYPEGAARVAILGLNVALYGAWSYAIAMAAYGNKGALAALFAYAALWGFGQGGVTILFAFGGAIGGAIHVANLAVGALGMVAIWREMRARRGSVRWGDFALLVLPLFAQIALTSVFAPIR